MIQCNVAAGACLFCFNYLITLKLKTSITYSQKLSHLVGTKQTKMPTINLCPPPACTTSNTGRTCTHQPYCWQCVVGADPPLIDEVQQDLHLQVCQALQHTLHEGAGGPESVLHIPLVSPASDLYPQHGLAVKPRWSNDGPVPGDALWGTVSVQLKVLLYLLGSQIVEVVSKDRTPTSTPPALSPALQPVLQLPPASTVLFFLFLPWASMAASWCLTGTGSLRGIRSFRWRFALSWSSGWPACPPNY